MMDQDTYVISPRNKDAKRTLPVIPRMMSAIRMMMGMWTHQGHVADEMDDDRFGITTSYLVNYLGLKMYEDWRYEDGVFVQLHHLPRQDLKTVEHAILLLSKRERDAGMSDLLMQLVYHHPFPYGGTPSTEGFFTPEEFRMFGMTRSQRGEEGLSLMETALKWISQDGCWLTTREFRLRTGSSRLAANIRSLREEGYLISVYYEPNKYGSFFARYHYFEDEAQRNEWFERHGDRPTKEQVRAALFAHGGGLELDTRDAPPEAPEKARPKPVVVAKSPYGVPAQLLDDAFPNAKPRQVVPFKGLYYKRLFRPLQIDGNNIVKGWSKFWVGASEAEFNKWRGQAG